ncbi:D-alanyl-D-alanine carboxypeptidase [Streptomyces griseoluteus]|uniref:D-alanyl-D-alanine carboxypeptidase n=1 Tax=Streptomyces griseoluteus TaxID=29306 RepID=A0A4Z1DPT2_STRGP|nr:serine hydrolase [Streptomyces griseoluteus]TGN85742.1 D-alanyl-D-alanine carboxypeptidase [Streptomyces griseoluteus]
MRESTPLSRRALLGLAAAAVPLTATAPASAAGARSAGARSVGTGVVGGERLGLGGVQVRAAGLPKKLTAQAWLVADRDTGEVLASYNAHRRLAPASTLKMLFADTVLPKFAPDQRYRVTDADLTDIPSGSSLVGVQAGTTYTVEQLWQGVFLRSGNDAVHVLAHMNGGIARTVAEMQARAEYLHALDTHVVSPDGFDHKGQISSAYDLTLFARAGLKNPDFRRHCGTRTADFPAGGRKTFQIQNTDRLLTGAWGLRPYAGLLGVKNGYTSHAGNTFTGAATRGGRTLLVTVMHPAEGSNAVYEQTAALLDWGFGAGRAARPVGLLAAPGGTKAARPTVSPLPAEHSAHASATPPGPSTLRLAEGAAGTAALLGAGAWALLRRRRAGTAGVAAEAAPGGRRGDRAADTTAGTVPPQGGRRRAPAPENPTEAASQQGGRHRR